MILADVVRAPGRAAPVVRLRVDAPAGMQVSLVGEAAGLSWTVGAWLSDGQARVMADPLAPLGEEASYRVTYGSTVETAGPVLRPSPGECVISTVDGVADALTAWYGDDPQEVEPRVHELVIPGAALPIHNLDLVAGAGGGTLQAHTEGPQTGALAGLVGASVPVVLLHDSAGCQITECDIPAARTVVLIRASNMRAGISPRAVRAHEITYRYARRDETVLAPIVTVGDYLASTLTVGDLAPRQVVDVAAGVPLVTGV